MSDCQSESSAASSPSSLPEDAFLFDTLEDHLVLDDHWAEISTAECSTRRRSISDRNLDLLKPLWHQHLSEDHEVSDDRCDFGSEVFEPTTTEMQECNKLALPDVASRTSRRPFVHARMQNPKTQIRLLSRAPEIGGWLLDHCHLESAPLYAALSYEWGSTISLQPVQVNGGVMLVTPNCALALQQLWPRSEIDHFWIDAICINQKDDTEKGYQVQAMAEIYTQARWTLVSLGLHDIFSQRVYSAMKSYDKAHNVRMTSLLSSQAVKELFGAFIEVTGRSYWQRLWVYQELILSKDLVLLCGRDVATWASFAGLLHEFELCMGGLGSLPSSFKHSYLSFRALVKDQPGYHSVIDVRDKRSGNGGLNEELDIYRLLEATSLRKCSNIQDRVFAVMRLVQWPHNFRAMSVSYHKEPLDIAWDVLKHYPSYDGNEMYSILSLIRGLQLSADDLAVNREKLGKFQGANACSKPVYMLNKAPMLIKSWMGTAPLRLHAGAPDGYLPDASQQIPPSAVRYLQPAGFRGIMDGAQVLGFVSERCKSGDIVMELRSDVHIVIRKLPDGSVTSFEVIGRALLQSGAFNRLISLHRWTHHLGEWAISDIKWDFELGKINTSCIIECRD